MSKQFVRFKCASPISSKTHLIAPAIYVTSYREMRDGGHEAEKKFIEILKRFHNKTGLELLPLGGFTRHV